VDFPLFVDEVEVTDGHRFGLVRNDLCVDFSLVRILDLPNII
jgi:hypothetical protein